jgi:hypothetical protein
MWYLIFEFPMTERSHLLVNAPPSNTD